MSLALTPATEERLQRELETGNFREPDALLNHLLDLLEAERDNVTANEKAMEEWLLRNKEAVRAAIEESLAAEARGESFSPEEFESMLNERRAQRRAQAA